jgi:hypothetical protein
MFKFSKLENAQGFAKQAIERVWIVKFEGQFIVTTPAQAAKLERRGGEILL